MFLEFKNRQEASIRADSIFNKSYEDFLTFKSKQESEMASQAE